MAAVLLKAPCQQSGRSYTNLPHRHGYDVPQADGTRISNLDGVPDYNSGAFKKYGRWLVPFADLRHTDVCHLLVSVSQAVAEELTGTTKRDEQTRRSIVLRRQLLQLPLDEVVIVQSVGPVQRAGIVCTCIRENECCWWVAQWSPSS